MLRPEPKTPGGMPKAKRCFEQEVGQRKNFHKKKKKTGDAGSPDSSLSDRLERLPEKVGRAGVLARGTGDSPADGHGEPEVWQTRKKEGSERK